MEPDKTPQHVVLSCCPKCGLTRGWPIGVHRDGWNGEYGKTCDGKAVNQIYVLEKPTTEQA